MMNDQRNNASPPANIGISLLLVVFLILCLFTFSAIALVQAENEMTQATLTQESRNAYYAASNQAEEELARLNSNAPIDVKTVTAKKIEKQYEISDSRALYVVFKYDKLRQRYRFSEFKTISTTKWEGDDTVNVIR